MRSLKREQFIGWPAPTGRHRAGLFKSLLEERATELYHIHLGTGVKIS